MGVLEPGVLYMGVPLAECMGVLLWVEKEPEWPTRPALMTEILDQSEMSMGA